jgi:Succinylglutamate desuccinylase / Aspartoacylase family
LILSDLIRQWKSPDSRAIGQDAEELLRLLGGPTWIGLDGQDPSRTRAVTTLLHGNEPSGTRALHRFLRSQQSPATNVIALVASVDAALTPPGFAHRMLPGRKDLNRCFADAGTDPDACLARGILADLRATRPEALVDLHNTSGLGPCYGVGTRANEQHLALVSLFSGYHVLTDIRLGTLMEAAEDDWPTVTIECGGARDPRSDETAYAGLTRYLCAPSLFGARKESIAVSVLRHPIRVRLADGATVAYGREPAPGATLTLRRDIDRFNSSVLTEADPIGWAAGMDALTARDGHGVELRDELFTLRKGRLHARKPLRLFMATTDVRIATEDCLFYAVFCKEADHAR